jgi:hypothetical protein
MLTISFVESKIAERKQFRRRVPGVAAIISTTLRRAVYATQKTVITTMTIS